MNLTIGQRVKYSESALRPHRDYWLGLGRQPHKNNAKAALDARAAERGTVTAILEPSKGGSRGVEVALDSGAVHHSLPYLWTPATD
jgi:hypothetical protein